MRRKSDRVKTPVATNPTKRSSRRSKRSASDTEEKTQNSDNEHSENSGSEQDSDQQPIVKSRKKLSRNTKTTTNDEKPIRSRRGRAAKTVETVTEEDEEADSNEHDETEDNQTVVEKLKSASPEPVRTKSPVKAPTKLPTPEEVVETVEDVVSSEPVIVESIDKVNVEAVDTKEEHQSNEKEENQSNEKEENQSNEKEENQSNEKEENQSNEKEKNQSNEKEEQNNGSAGEISTSDVRNDDSENKSDDDNRVKTKSSKDRSTSRRKHRKSSSDHNEPQPSEPIKDSPKKRRNRFSSPVKESETKVDETKEAVKNSGCAINENEEPTTDVSIKSKTPEREVIKENSNEKPQESDDRKSRGEKENKDKKRSDEKVSSSEKKQKPVRKRKWLTQKSTESKTQVLAISTDSLKNLISDVKPVPLSDVKLESSPEPEEIEIVSKSEPVKVANDSRERSHRKEHRNETRQEKKHDERTTVSSNRKISIVNEDTAKVQRPPSPPKFSSSNILFITNLVRPFTVLQLKGLLARTGKIVDDGFWIDKIKSKCYVKYETEDEAIETRHALHGVRWPSSNPKCLNVDFGSAKNMDKAIASTSEQISKEGTAVVHEERVSEGWDRFEVEERKEPTTMRPMREWDVGKKDDLGKERERDRGDRNRERDRDRERDHVKEHRETDRLERRKRTPDRNKRTHSISPGRKFHKKENEPPIRLLDDLFRKTKTVPCVYWLPLTSEQIVLKEEDRRKQLAEQKRRYEQREKERNERERERERERSDRNRSSDRRRDQSRNKDGDRNERDRDRRRY